VAGPEGTGLMEKYPLSWPTGWKRVEPANRTRAKFSKGERHYSSTPGGNSYTRQRDLTVSDGVQRVKEALRMLGVLDGDSIISTNLVTRLDGLPRSDQKAPADPGVAVYWQRPGEPMRCMAIDIYDRVADNLAAIAATLEAMRAIERHGGAQIIQRAFTGFVALPAPGKETRPWCEVLGVSPNASVDDVEKAYRRLRSTHHPDNGGSADQFDEIRKAYDRAIDAIT